MSDLHISIAVVVFAICDQKLSVLTLKRKQLPFSDQWALPTTQIDVHCDAHLEDAISRELKNLIGLEVPYVEQVHTVGNQYRDPRGWSITVAYYSLVSCENLSNTEQIQWMPVEHVLKTELAFDHHQIIENCLQRLQNKSLYTSLPIFLLPSEFTLTELQKTYETILGFKVEKKSFRRRLLDAGFLKETGNIRRASHRPAQLFRLAQPQPYFFTRIIEGVRESKSA